jgi:hypothetical protein
MSGFLSQELLPRPLSNFAAARSTGAFNPSWSDIELPESVAVLLVLDAGGRI